METTLQLVPFGLKEIGFAAVFLVACIQLYIGTSSVWFRKLCVILTFIAPLAVFFAIAIGMSCEESGQSCEGHWLGGLVSILAQLTGYFKNPYFQVVQAYVFSVAALTFLVWIYEQMPFAKTESIQKSIRRVVRSFLEIGFILILVAIVVVVRPDVAIYLFENARHVLAQFIS